MKYEPLDLSLVGTGSQDIGTGESSIKGVGRVFHYGSHTLETHFLFLGGTGTGKTNAIFQFVRQIKDALRQDDLMIVFDTKGDYSAEFRDPSRRDILISANSGQDANAEAIWNVFEDAKADGEENWDQNCNEIARTIFDEKIHASKDPFFPEAASDIVRVVMLALLRTSSQSRRSATNSDLRRVLDSPNPDVITALLKPYPDLQGPLQYISQPTGQTQGVLSVVQSAMGDFFQGAFAESGSFSVRNFVRARGAKTLFIRYDLRWGRVLTPVYRLLIDLAIKESLGSRPGKGNVFFVIDEFGLLPNLYHIDDGINFGRGQGVKFLVGTQNTSQILQAYGDGRGKSILSNFGTLFAFRLNDQESRDLVSSRYGSYQVNVRLPSPIPNEPLSSQIVEAKVLSDLGISLLRNGQCIVCPSGAAPQVMQFDLYQKQNRSKQASG